MPERSLRELVESHLGTSVRRWELEEARAYAEHKLALIIEREGDMDGARREPDYLAQLIAETVGANRLSQLFREINEITELCKREEEMGTKKDSPCQKHRAASYTSPYCTTAVPKMQ